LDVHNDNWITPNLNQDYLSQKEDIQNKLKINQNLTVVSAFNYLQKLNTKAQLENKRHPLEYEQAKKIIRDFRIDNNI